MPVFNGAAFIRPALESVLAQNPGPDEVLVADNASTDETVDIVSEMAATDDRVSLHAAETNQGASYNFNRLPGLTTADLFVWATYDDVWGDGLLGAQIDALADPTVSVAFGARRSIDSSGADIPPPSDVLWTDSHDPVTRLKELLGDDLNSHLHNCYPVLGLMRRSALMETGLILPYGHSDRVLIVEMALRGRLVEVAPPFKRRWHPESSVEANPDASDLDTFLDTTSHGPGMPMARLSLGFTRAVLRSGLPVRTKLSALSVVRGWILRGRRPRVIAGEVRRYAQYRAAHTRRSITRR